MFLCDTAAFDTRLCTRKRSRTHARGFSLGPHNVLRTRSRPLRLESVRVRVLQRGLMMRNSIDNSPAARRDVELASSERQLSRRPRLVRGVFLLVCDGTRSADS